VSWKRKADTLHRLIADEKDISRRLHRIADSFLDSPHISTPLLGGPTESEKLVLGFDAFDCVTFIENTLALARSRSGPGFIVELKKTRYRDSLVDWSSRLHYFSDWLVSNEERGAVRIRTKGSGSRAIEATIGLIEGLPPRRIRFHVVPKKKTHLALPRISDGSIVAFASVRSRLDFFHAGLLFANSRLGRSGGRPLLYHASQSAGKVVVEPLGDFLERNRMRGIAFAAPLAPGDPE